MKIAVCDDDKGCLDSMKRLLAGYPGISRTEYYQNLSQLSEALENGMGYDLVLMDIEWEGNEQDGIAYAAQYNARSPQTRFIFVTAYNDKFSEKIFWEKVNLCGFLVKPVRKEHLEKLLDKVREKIFSSEALILQHGGITEKIANSQIRYIESNAHQLLIHTISGEVALYEKLDVYEKKLQYPVKIKNPNPKLAAVIISQYGGPDGELGASLRYLSQRYSMPYAELKGLLTDIGTEELGHLEMVGAIVHQLTRNLSDEDIRTAGFDTYFVDHTTGVYPTAASGFPWSAGSIAVTGDMIADLTEDLAAEQKARVTYDNILRLSDDPDVNDVIKFLREREIVHFQRFGEGLRLAKDKMNEKNLYFINPSFDK